MNKIQIIRELEKILEFQYKNDAIQCLIDDLYDEVEKEEFEQNRQNNRDLMDRIVKEYNKSVE